MPKAVAAEIRNAGDLMRISPKDSNSYKGVPLVNLVAYSLYWIQQWQLKATFEAATVLSWRLFPTAFSLVGFSQLPDAARVNRSLLQGQPKYRNVLTGTPTRGYHLNQRGEAIALLLAQRFGVPEDAHGESLGVVAYGDVVPIETKRRTIDPKSEVERARASRLFQKWKTAAVSEKDVIHVHSLLGIFDHTPAKERQRAFKELMDSAVQVEDEAFVNFLESIREMFPSVFVNRQK